MIAAAQSDRMRVESVAAKPVRMLTHLTRARAYRAWRQTADVDAVVGSIRNSLAGMVPLLGDAMVAAHLRGLRRTRDNVEHFTKGGIVLSTAYDGAIEYLAATLAVEDAEVEQLRSRYLKVASDLAAGGVNRLSERLALVVPDAVRQATGGTTAGTRAISGAFDSTGFGLDNPFEVAAVFETGTQQAYGSGRWDSFQHPALADLLWGYQYAAIIDGRETQLICHPLNRMVRPKDDEVWRRLWPPNHWRCRSTVLEMFHVGRPTPVPAVSPQSGFGGRIFGNYAPAVATY